MPEIFEKKLPRRTLLVGAGAMGAGLLSHRVFAAAALASALASPAALGQPARGDITFADSRIFPESLTSTRDGAVYVDRKSTRLNSSHT